MRNSYFKQINAFADVPLLSCFANSQHPPNKKLTDANYIKNNNTRHTNKLPPHPQTNHLPAHHNITRITPTTQNLNTHPKTSPHSHNTTQSFVAFSPTYHHPHITSQNLSPPNPQNTTLNHLPPKLSTHTKKPPLLSYATQTTASPLPANHYPPITPQKLSSPNKQKNYHHFIEK